MLHHPTRRWLYRLNLMLVLALILAGLPPQAPLFAASKVAPAAAQGVNAPADAQDIPQATFSLTLATTGNSSELTWPSLPAAQTYQVHRSSIPFFTPNSATLLTTLPANPTTYVDANAFSSGNTTYFYRILGSDGAGNPLAASEEMGVIRYALNNSGQKYSLVALPSSAVF